MSQPCPMSRGLKVVETLVRRPEDRETVDEKRGRYGRKKKEDNP